jgi:hypothetical protein
MAIWVFEVTRINTPRSVMSCIGERGASCFRLVQYLIDLAFAAGEVPKTELCGAWCPNGVVRIFGKLTSRIKGKGKAAFQVKHHYGPGGVRVVAFEVVGGNTLCGQTKAVAIKRKRPIQVVDPKRDDTNVWLHYLPTCGS